MLLHCKNAKVHSLKVVDGADFGVWCVHGNRFSKCSQCSAWSQLGSNSKVNAENVSSSNIILTVIDICYIFST